jgi:hypothetical protein
LQFKDGRLSTRLARVNLDFPSKGSSKVVRDYGTCKYSICFMEKKWGLR